MKPVKIARQFGLWDSSITPRSMAQQIRLSDLAWDRDGTLVWLEVRSGRGVLVAQPLDGQAPRELNPERPARAGLSYGGGDFTVGDGQFFFIEADSGRIYRQPLKHGTAHPVTPGYGHAASPVLSPDGDWLLFVHSYEEQDTLAMVDAQGKSWPQKLDATHDFYMQPAWHPSGNRIAWIAWNHGCMPWDGTYLFIGKLQHHGGPVPSIEEVLHVAGSEDVSIFQPEFSPDGRYLAYASDESGWWQLHLYDLQNRAYRQLTHAQAEHAVPAWLQGLRTYAFGTQGDLVFLRSERGFVSLWQMDLASGEERRLKLDDRYTYLEQIRVASHHVALLASGGNTPTRVITCGYERSAGAVKIWRRSTSENLLDEAYSNPEPISWQGMDNGAVYGLYYPPCNDRFEGVGKPPLIVHIHGGPTSQVGARFNLQAQFFASRGYAVLEVNYRGSSGYGRPYRNLLRGNWGVYDVQDAVSGAKHLASQNLVDGGRLVIMGGSAGGFTVLKALEDYPGFFKAGVCLYGVSNQFTLAAETHKFELHYSDILLGSLPEAAEVYRQRSPIYYVEHIQDPLALFQGEDDKVVKRDQSDEVAASLMRRGIPHIYHLYAGEGHGFRKAETIEHLYRTIETFLRQYVIYC